MSISINLNPETKMTLKEIEKKKKELRVKKRELSIKESMGMPMTAEEYTLLERIDALINECDSIIEWMVMEKEEKYDWTID